jgi:transcriptional regulator GlxA family with amidase domain
VPAVLHSWIYIGSDAYAESFVPWLGRNIYRRTFDLSAICIQRAGLLDQRMVTTHGSYADELAALCPTARVEVDRPFVEDGNLYTSAGVTAAVDLSLNLLKLDKGSDVALKVAERLFAFMQRAAGKSQSGSHFTPYAEGRPWVAQVQQYVLSNLTGDLSVKVLARVANMSIRTFARAFVRDARILPAEYVVRVRLDAARLMLQGPAIPLKTIEYECGLGSADHMRCVFQRYMGVSPKQYRQSRPAGCHRMETLKSHFFQPHV